VWIRGSLLATLSLALDRVSNRHSYGFGEMTRNRTAVDAMSAIGTEFMVVLLLVLAMGLAVSEYFTLVRDRVRRVEVRVRRRAARRVAL
jgi:hypothetical protein